MKIKTHLLEKFLLQNSQFLRLIHTPSSQLINAFSDAHIILKIFQEHIDLGYGFNPKPRIFLLLWLINDATRPRNQDFMSANNILTTVINANYWFPFATIVIAVNFILFDERPRVAVRRKGTRES